MVAASIMYDEFIERVGYEGVQTAVTAKIDLFTNDYVPDRADNIADFVLGAWDTYAQVPWTIIPPTFVGHKKSFPPKACSFSAPTSGSPNNVFGYVVRVTMLESGSVRVMQAARFLDAPIVLAVGDAAIVFTVFQRWYDRVLVV